MIIKHIPLYTVFLCSLALAGCGGGGGSDGSGTGELSVAVTDAAVDSAEKVMVEFTEVEIKPQGGGTILFELDEPMQLDLLDLQGMEFEPMIQSETVEAGRYNWIRLGVNDSECDASLTGDNPPGSYIEFEDGSREPLHIPSGAESGLKLVSGFTVAAGGQTNVTVDFDVRKSVTAPNGQDCHFLKPALRLVDNAEVGHIAGTVNQSLLLGPNCSDADPLTGNAIYLFNGDVDVPDDIDGDEVEPITSAIISQNETTGIFEYEIGFVLAGEYKVALTCNADLDDPEVDNSQGTNNEVVTFDATQPVTVEVDTTSTASF